MKPTVAEYLRQKETVRGWLQDIDARVMLAIDWLQRGRRSQRRSRGSTLPYRRPPLRYPLRKSRKRSLMSLFVYRKCLTRL